MNLETYFENLREHILEKHPDVSDSESVLEMIYECYAQLNQMDNETIRKDFDELYQAMHGHSLREIDKVIYTVCLLCRDHEKAGFVNGVRIGIRLEDELLFHKNLFVYHAVFVSTGNCMFQFYNQCSA